MEKINITKLMEMNIEEREIEIYNILKKIDCSEHIEKLNQSGVTLSYLSWAWAVDTLQSILPMTYEIKQFDDGTGKLLPYQSDNATGYMVMTEITILGIKKSMWLPVMDSSNKAMKSEAYSYTTKFGTKSVNPATMFDVNKTIMRCLVKNISMFGLGLYIYAGEDLPPKEKEYITKEQINEMTKLGVKVDGVLKTYGITKIEELEKSQAEFVIDSKRRYLEKNKAEKGE